MEGGEGWRLSGIGALGELDRQVGTKNYLILRSGVCDESFAAVSNAEPTNSHITPHHERRRKQKKPQDVEADAEADDEVGVRRIEYPPYISSTSLVD